MKIAEKFIADEKQVHHIRTFDFNPVMQEVTELRQLPKRPDGNWHIGRIPAPIIDMWLREAGVQWSDNEAVREIIERKLLSGEYSKLRPHEGKFK